MNKKKLITMLTALALVGAIGVGATLAYLSDKTQELTNTFTFATNGIGVGLDEAKVDENNKATSDRIDASDEDKQQEYKNIIPGMILDKDPTVTITANSLNCNVFVSVKNANEEDVLKINGAEGTDAWTEGVWADGAAWAVVDPETYGLKAADNTKYYVYQGTKATGTVETGDAFKVVPTSANPTVLEDVFQTLTVGKTVTAETKFENIVIKAAAVQADSCVDDEAAKTALEMLINAD